MAAKKKKSLTNNSAITKIIDSSVSNLVSALENVDKAISAASKESKKLLGEVKRMKKRRMTQASKKKRAVAANKKKSSGDSRKAVRSTKSELATTNKVLAKATAARQAVTEELSGLKESQKKLSAYVKGITSTDRKLAKPKKKRKKAKR